MAQNAMKPENDSLTPPSSQNAIIKCFKQVYVYKCVFSLWVGENLV